MRARDAASRLVAMRTKNSESSLLIKAGVEPALIMKTIQFNIEKGLGLWRAMQRAKACRAFRVCRRSEGLLKFSAICVYFQS